MDRGNRTRQTRTPVGAVRRDLRGPGFALLDTPPFFDADLLRGRGPQRTVLTGDDGRWWRYPRLARYACWLESLLTTALPEESLSLASLELRHERADTADPEVDRLHADGSYVRSVYSLYGEATVYRADRVERPVPEGMTLLLTALDRARALRVPCTLHRRPGPGPERALVVCSFEPQGERPRWAKTHRRAAQSDRPLRAG